MNFGNLKIKYNIFGDPLHPKSTIPPSIQQGILIHNKNLLKLYLDFHQYLQINNI